MMVLKWCASVWLVILALGAWGAPASFEQAKTLARQHVYHDRTASGTFYCGCQWQWFGRSGGRVDWTSCGYEVRAQEIRAKRTEWEHIVPASNFGRARQCWQDGGRRHCASNDPLFGVMEADLHNLTPAVGEINADRSNYNFGVLPGTAHQHGACTFKIDFQQRTVEPPDRVKGKVARVYFYMHDRYDLPMSSQQQQLLMTWDTQHPPSEWELERNMRIVQHMGHGNPFVTRERTWSMGHRNRAEGLASGQKPQAAQSESGDLTIRGNRNSKVYHFPTGCPSYGLVSESNIVEFETEADAVEAEYRKAGNCR